MNTQSLISIFFITTALLIFSCNNKGKREIIEKYPNGKAKTERTAIMTDSYDYKCKDFYPEGKLKSIYFLKDGLIVGHCQNYYFNGNIESEGDWVKGQRNGYFKFYDSTGTLEKKIEYINYRGAERPNQIIKLDKNGDTLLNGQSLFYDFYYNKDTIKLNKEQYEFKIVLTGHLYDSAHISFCDFDERYFLKSDSSCEGVKMKTFEVHLFPKKYKIGENYIRGRIDNYGNSELGVEPSNTHAEIYFSDTFYVIP